MPPELTDVALLAIMNPAVLVAGFVLGRRADQPQKIVLAGLIAGIAGAAFVWLLMATGLYPPKVRLLGGVFVASAVLGAGWAWLGYATRKKGPDAG